MNSLEILNSVFHLKSFRNNQENIINSICFEKRDVCGIMATGYGKSVCYQLPPIILNKPSIVISPLISLMEDQRIKLSSLGIESICYNSDINMNSKLKPEIIDKILRNYYKVIYMTPEMITTEFMLNILKILNLTIGISVIAIDESHCVSTWGNSFRKSYLELHVLRTLFQNVPILALTGTATLKIRNDIINLLNLKDPLIINTGANRPNITYFVHQKENIKDFLSLIDNTFSSIVYCQKRETTEKICNILKTNDILCDTYHAGMSNIQRDIIHKKFITNELKCIVATIAFGMGIDKPDIRKVIHYGCPKDIESYVQETGRAGRDGLQSESHVFYAISDFAINRFFLKDIESREIRTYREESIQVIEKYLYITTCRRQYLINHFSDTKEHTEHTEHTEHICCDNCCSNLSHLKTHNNAHKCVLKQTNIGKSVKLFLDFVSKFPNRFGKLMYINILMGLHVSKIPMYFKNSIYFNMSKSGDVSIDNWKLYVQHLLNDEFLTEKSVKDRYGTTISVTNKGIMWLKSNLNVDNPVFIIKSPENPESPENSESPENPESPESPESPKDLALACFVPPIINKSQEFLAVNEHQEPHVISEHQESHKSYKSCDSQNINENTEGKRKIKIKLKTNYDNSTSVPISTSTSIPISIHISTFIPTSTSTSTSTSIPTSTFIPTSICISKKKLSDTCQISWNHFKNNMTIKEISNIRSMATSTIEGHIVEGLKYSSFNKNDLETLGFNEDIYLEIKNIINGRVINNDYSKLSPIKQLCNTHISYLYIKIAISILILISSK